MNHQESDFRPHSRADDGGSQAARTHDGQDPQMQSQEWHPLTLQADVSQDKDHTYTGKTGREPQDTGESRDPDHELNLRGEATPHSDNSKHKSRGHHSGGSSDPGFGAFDRG